MWLKSNIDCLGTLHTPAAGDISQCLDGTFIGGGVDERENLKFYGGIGYVLPAPQCYLLQELAARRVHEFLADNSPTPASREASGIPP